MSLDLPGLTGRSDSDFYEVTAFSVVLAHETLYAPFNSGVSVFPNPMEFLISSPTGFQSQMVWGLLNLMPGCHQEPDIGLRNFTPGRKFLQYNYSPVCGLPTWVVWGLIILQLLPSYPYFCGFPLSLELTKRDTLHPVFSYWWLFNVNFNLLFLWKEVSSRSFYSTLL